MGRVTIELSGDEARLIRALDKVVQKERELARKALEAGEAGARGADKARQAHGKLGEAIGGVEKDQDKAFGTVAIERMAKYAAGVASVTAAASLLVDTLQQAQEIQERMAQQQRDAGNGLLKLAQLGGGDSGRVEELGRNARELFAAGGAGSLDEAAGVIFQLESAGINDSDTRQLFGQLGGIIGDSSGFARSARTLQGALGAGETGSIREILSKAFAASSASPAETPALLEAAASAGAFAGELGVSDEELLAAVAQTATTSGSAAMGGTQVRALLKALGRDDQSRAAVRSGGLIGAIQNLEARGLTSQAGFESVFGQRAEAFIGLQSLRRDLPGLSDQVGLIEGADGLAEQIAASATADPAAAAARARMIADAQLQLAGEQSGLAGRENLVQLIQEREHAQLQARGHTFTSAATRGIVNFVRGTVGQVTDSVDDSIVRAAIGRGDVSLEEIEKSGSFREIAAEFRAAQQELGDRMRPPTLSEPGDD